MFDDLFQFYPTPDNLIDKMVRPYVKELERKYHNVVETKYYLNLGRNILEPSAGKGNIVDRLVNHYNCEKSRIACCEIQTDLRTILIGKGYKVIDTDFLEYSDMQTVDCVIMNPPFRAGYKHLLKAWSVLRHGVLICVLNANTVRTNEKLQELIDIFGEVEFLEQEFESAERKTNVVIAIVRLEEPEVKQTEANTDQKFDKDHYVDETFQANPLAHSDLLESIISQYNKVREIVIQQHELQKELAFYTKGIGKSIYDTDDRTIDAKLKEIKEWFWGYIFERTKGGRAIPTHFQKKWDEFVKSGKNLAFTRKNIEIVLSDFIQNREAIMKECIVEVFDDATSYHKKNKIHTEGWVSNKSWKLADKIIYPWGLPQADGDHFFGPRNSKFTDDLDRCFAYLNGDDIDKIKTIDSALNEFVRSVNQGDDYRELFESEYFTIRAYKKGTIHLMAKDSDLLARFNIIASENKDWIGGGY